MTSKNKNRLLRIIVLLLILIIAGLITYQLLNPAETEIWAPGPIDDSWSSKDLATVFLSI